MFQDGSKQGQIITSCVTRAYATQLCDLPSHVGALPDHTPVARQVRVLTPTRM